MARKIADPTGVVVIGLGRFAKSLADELEREGVQVLAIDDDVKRVQELAGRWSHIVQADATDVDALAQLGVGEFATAVIGIGNNLEASVLTAFALRKLGVEEIWAKAITTAQGEILTQVGVTHVIRPEHEMGRRVAHLVRGRMKDYIEFDDGWAIARTAPPRSIIGQTLAEAAVRERFAVTVVGVKPAGQALTDATPGAVLHEGDLILVSGERDKVERFCDHQ